MSAASTTLPEDQDAPTQWDGVVAFLDAGGVIAEEWAEPILHRLERAVDHGDGARETVRAWVARPSEGEGYGAWFRHRREGMQRCISITDRGCLGMFKTLEDAVEAAGAAVEERLVRHARVVMPV